MCFVKQQKERERERDRRVSVLSGTKIETINGRFALFLPQCHETSPMVRMKRVCVTPVGVYPSVNWREAVEKSKKAERKASVSDRTKKEKRREKERREEKREYQVKGVQVTPHRI